MPNFICSTCGTQYPESALPPEQCVICTEERQYVGWNGQLWTTLAELRRDHRNKFQPEGSGLVGIGTEPAFAIGQRALYIRTSQGGVLWDCVSLVDDATVAAIQALGGVHAIAISHPHYYSSMIEWSDALGNVPIYLHAGDAQWVVRPERQVMFWQGATRELMPGVTLIQGCERVTEKEKAPPLLVTDTDCGGGADPSVRYENDRDVALTISEGAAPVTSSVTLTYWGELTAPEEVTVRMPLYVPEARPDGFTETLDANGVEPDAGLTVSQF